MMKIKIALFLSCMSFVLFSSTTATLSFTDSKSDDIGSMCSRTPYPQQCNYFMSQKLQINSTITIQDNFAPIQNFDFRKLSIKIAMERAQEAQRHNKWLESKSQNPKEKAAWADCLKLYRQTIIQLKKTLNPNTKHTHFDAQTWLSTALTNLETCRTGFEELGVSSNSIMSQLMSNNVSKLVSNALALRNNNDRSSSSSVVPPPQTYKHGFPSWVKGGDRRKLLQNIGSVKPNVVVAQDGSGDYTSIEKALDVASSSSENFVIYVKRGIYEEYLDIGLKNIMLVGDGMKDTIITGSRSVHEGGYYTTFNCSTVAVDGDGFIARGITFRNTAGPENNQAVAFRSCSDFSVFYQCGFEGYQDTLLVHSQRQFYRECDIYGTIDFIFGNAAVVFQNCMIYVRKPLAGQENVITAQGRTDWNQTTGISIQNSRIMAAEDLTSVKTFLGRPWKEYSRTVFSHCYLDSLVDPAGWLEWNGTFALSTLYYGEYKNIGPASSTHGRVKWRGYRAIMSESEASIFSVDNFIAGSSWLPATVVPFFAGT